MKLLGFNLPVTTVQWAKGAIWAAVGAATSVLATGDHFAWHTAGTAALVAFFAYLHESAPKGASHVQPQ